MFLSLSFLTQTRQQDVLLDPGAAAASPDRWWHVQTLSGHVCVSRGVLWYRVKDCLWVHGVENRR